MGEISRKAINIQHKKKDYPDITRGRKKKNNEDRRKSRTKRARDAKRQNTYNKTP